MPVTVMEMANEFRMQPYELKAFADDLLGGLDDADEIPAEAEETIREALAVCGGQI